MEKIDQIGFEGEVTGSSREDRAVFSVLTAKDASCAKAIEKALVHRSGVFHAAVNLTTKEVEVRPFAPLSTYTLIMHSGRIQS